MAQCGICIALALPHHLATDERANVRHFHALASTTAQFLTMVITVRPYSSGSPGTPFGTPAPLFNTVMKRSSNAERFVSVWKNDDDDNDQCHQLQTACQHSANNNIVHFLPRCMECKRGLTMRILSVRPSVCLSVCLSVCQTRALRQNRRKEKSVQIFIPCDRQFSLVF